MKAHHFNGDRRSATLLYCVIFFHCMLVMRKRAYGSRGGMAIPEEHSSQDLKMAMHYLQVQTWQHKE